MFDTSAQISKNKAPCAEKRHSAEADVSQRLATDSGCELESYQQAADSGALGFVRWSLKPRLNLRRAIRGSQATHIEAVKLRVSRRGGGRRRGYYLPASDSGAFSSPLKRIEMRVVTPRSCIVTP